MSDAAYARNIIEEIWPERLHSRKTIISSTFEAIKRFERSLPKAVLADRERVWTERRVRSIVDDEKPRLERYEVADLERMAVEEGRFAYRKSVERAARLAAFLAHSDEAFYGPHAEAKLAFARGLVSPGNDVAASSTRLTGEVADRPGEHPSRHDRPGTRGGAE